MFHYKIKYFSLENRHYKINQFWSIFELTSRKYYTTVIYITSNVCISTTFCQKMCLYRTDYSGLKIILYLIFNYLLCVSHFKN